MGWNGGGQKGAAPAQPKVTAKKPSPVRGLVAGIVVIAFALVAYFFFFSAGDGNPEAKATKNRGRIKAVTPSVAKKEVQRAEVEERVPETKAETVAVDLSSLKTEPIEEGLVFSEVPTTNKSELARDPVVNEVEIYLSMLGKPGTPYTPLPLDPNQELDESFAKALQHTIRIWDDDTDMDAEHKLMLARMKKELAEIHNGGKGKKVADVLREVEELRKYQYQVLSAAQSMVAEAEEGSPEHVAAVREKVNAVLAEEGIAELKKTETEVALEEAGIQSKSLDDTESASSEQGQDTSKEDQK